MHKERRRLITDPAISLAQAIHQKSGLSQAELSRRAGLPRSVTNSYLRGHRKPGLDALTRLANAAGLEIALRAHKYPVDPENAGRVLVQVLELAEVLPFRRHETLTYPKFSDLAKKHSHDI